MAAEENIESPPVGISRGDAHRKYGVATSVLQYAAQRGYIIVLERTNEPGRNPSVVYDEATVVAYLGKQSHRWSSALSIAA